MSRFSHTLCTLLVGAALSACAAPASQGLRQAVTPLPDCCRTTQADLRKRAIVQTAVNLVGAKTIESQGRRISYDCAGVMANSIAVRSYKPAIWCFSIIPGTTMGTVSSTIP